MLRLIGTLSCIWLVMAVSSLAQEPGPVLDTAGQPLQSGVEYYILPRDGSASGGGGLTLIRRNNPCPFYVGQEDDVGSDGFSVTFTSFFANETVIRDNRDLKVVFQAFTTCIQSTAWKLGETIPEVDRRLIVTGNDDEAGGYFRIENNGDASYNLGWCPTDVCPICRFRCGSAGILIENGKKLLALDGPALPVVFKKA